jgi:two-component system response regulator YesN
LKVLIADDEYYARKAMAKKILQVDPDTEILGDFENGVQVLAYLEAHPDEADVLLTDVKMPEMDGLYLAQYLFEQESRIEVIIISGYNEFEYARKAISFGVSNYLLKPVQKEELREALDKISRERKKYQEKMQDIMTERTVQFLSIEEISEHEDWSRLFLKPVFDENAGCTFYLAVIQSMHRENQTESQSAERFMKRLKNKFHGVFFYFNRFQENVLVLFGEKAEIVSELDTIVSQTEILGVAKITVGLSLGHTQMEHCTKAYEEAVYALNQRLIDGWNRLFLFTPDFKPENLLDKEKEQLLEETIVEKRCAQAEAMIREILRKCRNAYTLYVTISSIFNLLYRFFCRTDSREKDNSPGYMLFSYRTDLYRYDTLKEVEDYVVNIVKAMCEELEGKKYHYIVSEILNDVAQNYQENISIGELAEHKYFMNGSYLSRLFKNETGKTFSAYLMEYRMNKAKELLESDLLRISDVAMLAGYNDVSRFIQYFKKLYGVTPEEYRKKDCLRKGTGSEYD